MLNYFQNPDTVMSGWGLSKASISAGSSRLRKGRQLPGQPGHGGKKRRAPENKVEVYFGVLRWPPGSKKKKKVTSRTWQQNADPINGSSVGKMGCQCLL